MSDIIESKSKDLWGSENYGLPSGLYYYFLNENLPGWDTNLGGSILGNCPAIQSVQYVPFIEISDLTMFHVPYDTERFGNIDKIRPSLNGIPNVFRVLAINTSVKKIGSFTCYTPKKSIGSEKNWRNESRLYNYPFAFAMLSDNLNPAIEIKYHLCKNNINNILVRSTISDRCSYGLFIENYKGDVEGKIEAMVSGDAHELPCSSSAYSQWFASNKNQTTQDIKNVMQNSFLTKQTNNQMLLPNLLGNFASTTLNPLSVIGSGSNVLGDAIHRDSVNKKANLDIQQAINNKMSQTQDLLSTPNTMLSMGSDVYYGLDKGDKKVNIFRFGLLEKQYQKIGDYFAMFGYKQNKVFKPNIRNRYYYNYIKTTGINISSNYMPRQHLEQLKNIFDNGTTIWHIDRENVVVGDYSKDNYEI